LSAYADKGNDKPPKGNDKPLKGNDSPKNSALTNNNPTKADPPKADNQNNKNNDKDKGNNSTKRNSTLNKNNRQKADPKKNKNKKNKHNENSEHELKEEKSEIESRILLGSAYLFRFSAYAEKGNDKPLKDDDSPKNQENDKGKGNSGGDHNGDD